MTPLAQAQTAVPAPGNGVFGAAMGVGGYTFRPAEGLSYFSTEPSLA